MVPLCIPGTLPPSSVTLLMIIIQRFLQTHKATTWEHEQDFLFPSSLLVAANFSPGRMPFSGQTWDLGMNFSCGIFECIFFIYPRFQGSSISLFHKPFVFLTAVPCHSAPAPQYPSFLDISVHLDLTSSKHTSLDQPSIFVTTSWTMDS